MLLILSLTLTLNAVSAATNNNSTADSISKDKKVNTSTTTAKNNTQTKNTSSSTNYAAGSAAGSTKTIKVLIYSGTGASTNCVNGVKTSLATANSKKLLSGVKFTYATSSKLSSSILSGYNLLVMPGGSGGRVYLNTVSKSVIQNYVKNGGGYIGICAGAFAAAAHVDGWYNGWGIAPHVYSKAPIYEGKLNISISSLGAGVFKRSGTETLIHYNGGAMYLKGSGAKIFATYADNKLGYKGYAAIVGDFYGKGRTVLVGPHPELAPQKPDIIASLIAWATKTPYTINKPTTSKPTTTPKVTVSQVTSAASSVKSFFEKNKRLPNTVTINGNSVSMPKFLNLLAATTTQINSKSTASIAIKSVSSPTKISGTIKSGNVVKSEFLTIAKKITTFINTNGRAPNYVGTKLGNMSYTKIIYMFSKIVNFYKTNKRLPNYVAMTK